MPARRLDHHSRRFEITNELHARPFMAIEAPGRVITLAFKQEQNAQERDPEADRAHLLSLIDRHGGAHPAPAANHYMADFGRFTMKWERHTEFVGYMAVETGPAEGLFGADLIEHFPASWLDEAPGRVIAAVEIEIIRAEGGAAAEAMLVDGALGRSFHRESLAMAHTLDGMALAAGDFRIQDGGFTRFALVVHGDVGPRRIGRAVQRLIEIESYRSLAMLALPIARRSSARLNEIDRELSDLIRVVADRRGERSEQEILDRLTG
ncbi:MAG: DUF3422 family protein, partial [Pseudomonadota bacterium]